MSDHPLFVYFAQDKASGFIKLGVSKQPGRRIHEHVRSKLVPGAGHRSMVLLAAVRHENAFQVENEILQRKFKHRQVRGE